MANLRLTCEAVAGTCSTYQVTGFSNGRTYSDTQILILALILQDAGSDTDIQRFPMEITARDHVERERLKLFRITERLSEFERFTDYLYSSDTLDKFIRAAVARGIEVDIH